MYKTVLSLVLFLNAIVFAYAQQAALPEEVRLTTYYPSPYGSYKELAANRMKIGRNYSAQAVSDDNLIVEGNVGIGITNPQAKLNVVEQTAGTEMAIFRNEGGTHDFRIGDINGGPILRSGPGDLLYLSADSPSPQLTIVNNTGNVGIGTTNPQAKLDINGNIKATNLPCPNGERFRFCIEYRDHDGPTTKKCTSQAGEKQTIDTIFDAVNNGGPESLSFWWECY